MVRLNLAVSIKKFSIITLFTAIVYGTPERKNPGVYCTQYAQYTFCKVYV
jgi:hypothetical protein